MTAAIGRLSQSIKTRFVSFSISLRQVALRRYAMNRMSTMSAQT